MFISQSSITSEESNDFDIISIDCRPRVRMCDAIVSGFGFSAFASRRRKISISTFDRSAVD
jgi:hypothetical protein